MNTRQITGVIHRNVEYYGVEMMDGWVQYAKSNYGPTFSRGPTYSRHWTSMNNFREMKIVTD